MKPRLIKITVSDSWPADDIDLAVRSGFGGFGVAYQGPEARVIYLKPNSDGYEVLRVQLKIMEEEGRLSFVEEQF